MERNHGTHQDRVIKKLRRNKIRTHGAVNEFLEKEHLPEHNQQFAKAAASGENYHRVAPGKAALDEVFRLETQRTPGNDWVVRHNSRLYQVTRQSRYAPALSKVVVCEWEDGRLEIRYRGKRLGYEEIAERTAKPIPVLKPRRRPLPAPPKPGRPWRDGYQAMRPRRKSAA